MRLPFCVMFMLCAAFTFLYIYIFFYIINCTRSQFAFTYTIQVHYGLVKLNFSISFDSLKIEIELN